MAHVAFAMVRVATARSIEGDDRPGLDPGKRVIRMVGTVRWSRNHLRFKGNLSGGVGMVRGKLRGILGRATRLRIGLIER